MNSLQPDKFYKPVNETAKYNHSCQPPERAKQTGHGDTEQKHHVFVIANNSTLVKGGK